MYKSKLSIKQTQQAIQDIKFGLTKQLKQNLNLTRVSAPLFVTSESKINDGLNGDIPVVFTPNQWNEDLEIVHSLAKWKRYALDKYNFNFGEGIWADMNAIRKDDVVDYKHSLYVDQWDWELIISKEQRNLEFLKQIATKIYDSIRYVEHKINFKYPDLVDKLPKQLTFIDSLDLYNKYPNLTAEQREDEVAREYKAVFIYKIGYDLPDKKPHSKRAFDYDDWNLNGDLIFYDLVNDKALEISSMGIRVDAKSLSEQTKMLNKTDSDLGLYHDQVLNDKLPLTIGGGIGQSRLSMFLLEKAHIGEVQVSVWEKQYKEELKKQGIILL
ncbi:aspartate--ammonia ligase [Mycoplasma mycoides subsp. capri]|uniref:aspartate--ammonia ligase n=1 Tax=Mycoplasma mycoides TaxID=2102 RepID=UPI00223F1439|nr:aspartate--ammonia ligase [Mycoplasma mycoides]QVK01956.1 aspartate--ammonia ligase [Mycoplasma mycoides subsp. capri]